MGSEMCIRDSHPAPKSSSDQPGSVLVEVESHNWSDITVYLMAGGLPQRLGMVTALGAASFDFPSQRLNNSAGVRLRAGLPEIWRNPSVPAVAADGRARGVG